jgi:serine/threonine protein kinase
MPLAPDSILHGRYRILGELGRGGMGAVYRAHDDNLNVEVAIKENLVTAPEFEQQFKREATLLASLRHPNLPRVTDHFVIPGQGQYLVMDFVAGTDAKHQLETRGPLPEAEVIRWAREILDALHYLHTRHSPVIHRDIKPGNIRITPEGRAVLVDFGLAKQTDSAQHTATGARALTPGFSPPEQYGTGRTTPLTDLYAVGATLYTLLTGQQPPESMARLLGQKTLPPPQKINPAISALVASAIERAMALKPEDRFESAAQFSAALSPEAQEAAKLETFVKPLPAIRADQITHTAAPPALPPITPTAKPIPGWVWGVVTLLVIVGIGVLGLLLIPSLLPSAVKPTASPTPAPTVTVEVATTVPPATHTPPATETPAPTATPSATATPLPTATFAPTTTPIPTPTPALGGGRGQLAFVSERGGKPQIYLMDINGQNVSQLTSVPEGACQPAWSPDGAQLVFVTPCNGKKDWYEDGSLYIINVADTTGSAPKPFIVLIGGEFDPAWSTAGIAFTYLQNNQRPQVYVATSEGTNHRPLSLGRSVDSQMAWAPDGLKFAFRNTSRATTPTIYWMNTNGTFAPNRSNPDPITRDLDTSYPDWSPDGQYVLFQAQSQVWITQWDALGFNAVALTTVGQGANLEPVWSPDGQWIAFESNRVSSNRDIYRMDFTGQQATRLTDDPAKDYHAAWRP